MQDRFKFRVWDKTRNQYIYDIKLNCKTGRMKYPDVGCYITEQCTGLKDKNGKLIYEGDIVIEKDLYKRKTLVKWLDNKCGFNVSTTFGYDDGKCSIAGNVEYEVIGNIHEDPELLEV